MVGEEGDFESGAWKLDIDDREGEEEDDEEEELEEDNYVDVGDFSEDEDGDDDEEKESEESKQAGEERGDPFSHDDDEEEEASALSPTTGRVDPNRLLHIGKTWKVSSKTTYQEFFQKSFFPSHLKCQSQKKDFTRIVSVLLREKV